MDKNIYIVGGVRKVEDEGKGSKLVSCLDKINNTLSKLTDFPFKCASHGCAVVIAQRT